MIRYVITTIVLVLVSLSTLACSKDSNQKDENHILNSTQSQVSSQPPTPTLSPNPTPTSSPTPTPTPTPTSSPTPTSTPEPEKIYPIKFIKTWIYKDDVIGKTIDITGKFKRFTRNGYNIKFFLGSHTGIDCKFDPTKDKYIPEIVDIIQTNSDFSIEGNVINYDDKKDYLYLKNCHISSNINLAPDIIKFFKDFRRNLEISKNIYHDRKIILEGYPKNIYEDINNSVLSTHLELDWKIDNFDSYAKEESNELNIDYNSSRWTNDKIICITDESIDSIGSINIRNYSEIERIPKFIISGDFLDYKVTLTNALEIHIKNCEILEKKTVTVDKDSFLELKKKQSILQPDLIEGPQPINSSSPNINSRLEVVPQSEHSQLLDKKTWLNEIIFSYTNLQNLTPNLTNVQQNAPIVILDVSNPLNINAKFKFKISWVHNNLDVMKPLFVESPCLMPNDKTKLFVPTNEYIKIEPHVTISRANNCFIQEIEPSKNFELLEDYSNKIWNFSAIKQEIPTIKAKALVLDIKLGYPYYWKVTEGDYILSEGSYTEHNPGISKMTLPNQIVDLHLAGYANYHGSLNFERIPEESDENGYNFTCGKAEKYTFWTESTICEVALHKKISDGQYIYPVGYNPYAPAPVPTFNPAPAPSFSPPPAMPVVEDGGHPVIESPPAPASVQIQ